MSDPRLVAALEGLNREQREAVEATEGPVLVLAGAGSGKTRVITVRTARLIDLGVRPEEILAMTFTNKAAKEMHGRIQTLVGGAADLVTVGTFHSFCLVLLRENLERLGFTKRFGLCDASDQLSNARGALRDLGVTETHLTPAAFQSRLSLLKNRLISPEEAKAAAKDDTDALVADGYAAYQDRLRRARCFDFDDLLVKSVELLREHHELRHGLAKRYRYLMVDEYQDTCVAQYELLRLLARPEAKGKVGNLCAVGDDDQSIYGWRGAEVAKILGFERDFPGARVIKLETNYRSTPQILQVANAVIRNNTQRHQKTLRAAMPDGVPVELSIAPDETSEADKIILAIKAQVEKRTALFGDFAILFRTGTQPRPIEAQWRVRGVPYVLIGGPSFFDRKEVRDVLAYLRAALEPDDEPALLRVLNCPPRGIGKGTVDKLLELAAQQRQSVAKVLLDDALSAELPKAAVQSGRALLATLAEWNAAQRGSSLPSAIQELLERIGYRSEVERLYPDEATRSKRWAAVDEVIELARGHLRRVKKPDLSRFLNELALTAGEQEDRSDKDKDPERRRDVVTLMTLHAAKGLEFRQVYLVGLEEGILPHARSVAEEGGIEEERRLFYVGVTRAREKLVLSACGSRPRGGARSETCLSRFIYELKGETPPPTWHPAGQPKPMTKAQKAAKTRAVKRSAKR
jgi:DNA helicase II / ATP-dependent DNA helicase PcrA